MSFSLTQIPAALTIPSNLILFGGLLGVILLPTRFAVAGRRLCAACILVLAAVGFTPFGDLVARPLEGRFPARATLSEAPTGIIVLGGAIDPRLSFARDQVALGDAGERLTSAAALAHQYPDARIVCVGGNREFMGPVAEAVFAARLLKSLGVAESRITIETRSRNTTENARFVRALLEPKPGERWLLITSAMHMPRAIGAFRKAGFPVMAYPVDYQTTGRRRLFSLYAKATGGLRTMDYAAHEWAGLLIYWIAGQSSDLFPRPSVE